MDARLIDIAKLRKEMKAQDERRQRDPDLDPKFPDAWVLYGWSPKKRQWILAGFARTKHLRLPQLEKIRARLNVPKHVLVKLVTLHHAQRHGPPRSAPTPYNPTVERSWLAASLRGIRE